MQTELFDLPTPRTLTEESTALKASFLEKTFISLRLDQMIGLTLVLLVFYVLAFSWGVEKGKRSAYPSQVVRSSAPLAEVQSSIPVASAQPVKASAEASADVVVPRVIPLTVEELPKPVAKVTRPDGKYTIQHVTYVTQSAADREIQKLAQRGYRSFIIPSGKHFQVCIAAFPSRQAATGLLKKLRSEQLASGDAYVRPMIRGSTAG